MTTTNNMRALVQRAYGGVEQLELTTLPVPHPGKGELRLKVRACAVNLSDWEYLTGTPAYSRLVGGLFRPKQKVLGSDVVGIVDAIGSDVQGFAIGQRVMGDYVMTRGGFAEYVIVSAAETVEVPSALSDETAAALPQSGGIAVAGTKDLKEGSRFLINGAGGGSGPLALQLAKSMGASVTCVDHGGKIGWLTELGADDVINYREQDFASLGRRWDQILDMVATRGPGHIVRALNEGGQYQAVGGSVTTLLSLLFGGLFHRSGGRRIGMLLVPAGAELTLAVAKLAVEGKLNPHIEDVRPLDDCIDAIARTGRGDVQGKIIIRL